MKSNKPLNILVAEDNGIYRKLLCTMVERLTGQAPATASDGLEATTEATLHSYDLIFIDNHMPNVSGIEATEMIRESHPDNRPYIVAVTGTSDKYDLDAFESAGVDFILSKPFGLTELAAAIETANEAKENHVVAA